MAVHGCIGNPCWICYPKYAPDWNNNTYLHLEDKEPPCDCIPISGRHSLWCAALQWHFKVARQLTGRQFYTSDGLLL